MEAIELRLVTEDELMALGSDARVEIINGKIVKKPGAGGLHQLVAGNIYRSLYPLVFGNKLGYLITGGLIYLMFRNGNRLLEALVPDISYIKKASIPQDWDRQRPFPGAPTLAVEVMSPDDDAEDVLKKVRLYLKAGTEQVWVVFPVQQEIHVYAGSEQDKVRVYRGTEPINVETLFPGLSLIPKDIFTLPDLGL